MDTQDKWMTLWEEIFWPFLTVCIVCYFFIWLMYMLS